MKLQDFDGILGLFEATVGRDILEEVTNVSTTGIVNI